MNYAVPALLARSGMLAVLYTDIHADTALVRGIRRLVPAWLQPKPIRRLLGRCLPDEVPAGAIRCAPWRTACARLLRVNADAALSRKAMRDGLGGAEALYACGHGDVDLIERAAGEGLFVVFEQVISPAHIDILREERDRFPGLEPQEKVTDDRLYVAAHRRIWRAASVVLSPSNFVTDGIAAMGGETSKIRFVPYGLPRRLLENEPRPVPGRILFVGQVSLRKGSHYLAEAARILKARGVRCEFRVVGPVTSGLRNHPLLRGPAYAGQVPRTEIASEFLSADAFVLPSLAEGSATAHLEALAYGLPVITTSNCGSVVRDGAEGFIVPIRNASALANAIQRVVEDRNLRDGLSRSARLRASEFSWDQYEARLLAALGGRAPGTETVAHPVYRCIE